MNVFEDLIEELRDENLLEATIIDPKGSEATVSRAGGSSLDFALKTDRIVDRSTTTSVAAESEFETAASDENGNDFYRKRAADEISSLQIVEHVLSGVEREHMKMVPATYDDLEAKKALHRFLQVQTDSTTTDYAEAEFHLMRETETWSSALSTRDRKISVANLRRFCESSRPVLSSHALTALARYYRNSAFSELTRAKFDFVMTRLFSREIEGEKRRVLFGRSEMVEHIKTLYANWASVALYSAEDISLKAGAIVAGFADRVAEAECSVTFDQLIQNKFFTKVHEFKEATGEIFFTPEVVAATIDCNVKVGNKFVDLIRLERERTNLESVEEKYGYEYDQAISDAAGKTLQLVEVLKNLPDSDSEEGVDRAGVKYSRGAAEQATRESKKERAPWITFELFAVNKWLLIATIIVVLASTGLYFWSSQPSNETSSAENAADVSLENSPLKEYVRSGRATSETFYAIALPAWDQLDEAKKREVLQQAFEFAKNNGQKNVQFVNVRGRSVAFVSQKKVELLNP
ncbi:MAG: hypothetical protein ABI646_08990 [Acidobacteriota bacterium]